MTSTVAAPATVARPAASTHRLLAAGIAAGPLFVGAGLLQAATRDGFDLRRHALSQLATGDLWFLQVGVFLATGALLLAAARGIRRTGSGWLARLVGLYGVGMIVAGVFPTDPANAYPVGTPDGMSASLSWHGVLHGVGFYIAMTAWTACAVVAAVRYARRRELRWAAAFGLAPVAAVLVFALPALGPISVRIAEGAALQFAVMALLCAKLQRETSR